MDDEAIEVQFGLKKDGMASKDDSNEYGVHGSRRKRKNSQDPLKLKPRGGQSTSLCLDYSIT